MIELSLTHFHNIDSNKDKQLDLVRLGPFSSTPTPTNDRCSVMEGSSLVIVTLKNNINNFLLAFGFYLFPLLFVLKNNNNVETLAHFIWL
jgi:hypothetical protein